MDLWYRENKKFSDLVNWMVIQGSIFNKFSISHINESNRYIIASEFIEVKCL